MHIQPMKKLIVCLWMMFTSAFILTAAAASEGSSSNGGYGIFMEIHRKSNPSKNTQVNRAPFHIDISVYYNAVTNSVEVVYDGEAEGEVFLYNGDIVVGYDSAINTTLQLPDALGQYCIEIVGETWTATGKIPL